MLRSRILAFSLVGIASIVVLPAQSARVAELQHRQQSVAVGSLEWLCLGAERVEAWFDVDCAKAYAEAAALHEVAVKGDVPGAAVALAALAEFACCRLQGPAAAEVWRSRGGELPAITPAALRVCYHFARARCLCHAGLHAQELRHAIPGQAAADEIADPVLQLRAACLTLHVTPGRNLDVLRKLLAAGLAGPRSTEVATFRPWLLIEEYLNNEQVDASGAALRFLDEAQTLAEVDGNQRALATILCLRGNRLARQQDIGPALELLEQGCALYARIGDLREWASTLDMRAWLEVHRENFARANELLVEAEALVKDRGIGGIDEALIQSRLALAVRSREGDRAADLARELEARRTAAKDVDFEYRRVTAELRLAEEQREAAEVQLRMAEQRTAERSRATWTWAGIGVGTALALLAAMAWRSRRRLLLANARLAEEIARVEASQAAQSQLEQRMRQLEHTQSLGTMAAGVAHDFNNLLTGILGNAELLALTSRQGDIGQLAQRIVAAGKQAARMCQQLQACSGSAPLHPEALDLVAVVRDMVPVLRASITGADLQFVASDGPVGARIDRAQFEQVLLNLVVNAKDANASSVVVRVAVPTNQESPTVAEGRFVSVEVVDDGEGMDPGVVRRIFDPFFTTRFPGRGLGLAVASGIVQRHGGSLAVKSEPGRGATFTLLLPAAEAPVLAEPVVVLPSLPPASRAALLSIVDDEDSVRRVLGSMLRTLGHEAAVFASGEAALHALAEHPNDRPVVLFVDLTMPGMDGAEVVRRARELRPDVRIVLMSGHAGSHVDRVSREVAPDQVLRKPFTLDVLRTLLASVLEPHREQPAP